MHFFTRVSFSIAVFLGYTFLVNVPPHYDCSKLVLKESGYMSTEGSSRVCEDGPGDARGVEKEVFGDIFQVCRQLLRVRLILYNNRTRLVGTKQFPQSGPMFFSLSLSLFFTFLFPICYTFSEHYISSMESSI